MVQRITVHLENHDVVFGGVARAAGELQAFKQRMGWTFPQASSFSSDFNDDFNVRFTEEQQRKAASSTTIDASRIGYARQATPVGQIAAMTGTDATTRASDRE
jgi:predicted dithiol-disulfide oxidoreductase (DUF899 family)